MTNWVPRIVVERAVPSSPDDQPFGAGHAGAGVASPATSWFFAEGSTARSSSVHILLANGGGTAANVSITFTPGRASAHCPELHRRVPTSRSTVWVDPIPGLEATAVSAAVTSTVPIVAERTMWSPGTGESWREAHVSMGAMNRSPVGGRGPRAGRAERREFLRADLRGRHGHGVLDDGTAPVACGSSAGGRFTLHVNGFAGVAGKRFVSMIIEGNANTVVEHATYFNTGGEVFGAGGAALAVKIP